MEKANNKLVYIIIGAFTLVIIILLLAISTINTKSERYTIKYYDYDDKEYTLIFEGQDITVKTTNQVQCIKAPCPPINTTFKVKNKAKFNKLKEKLFNRTNKKAIKVYYQDLSYSDRKTMSIIVKEEDEIPEDVITYGKEDIGEYNSKYSQKGYYIEKDKDSNKYFITVSMGTKSSGGYNLEIVKVKTTAEDVEIYVKETEPKEGEAQTMALTYPASRVIVDKLPEDIIVQSLVDNSYYKEVTTIKED